MLVVIAGDPRVTVFVGELADDRERLADPRVATGGKAIPRKTLGDATPDGLGQRDAAPTRPTLELSMLVLGELHLSTHHDGIVVPSLLICRDFSIPEAT